MRVFNIGLIITTVIILSCATSRISNLTPMALRDEPLIESYKDPDFSFENFRTFSVFPKSFIDSSAQIQNPILEKQMLFLLRNFFEMNGYTFVDISENPDFLVTIDGSSNYKESYVPPQTYMLPRWVPGKTSTTYETNRGSFNFSNYGDYSSYGWGNWTGNSSSTTYTPGHMSFDSYSIGGYYRGSYYPVLSVQAFEGREFKQMWYSIGVGTSPISDLRISCQFVLANMIFDDFPPYSKLPDLKNESTGAIGIDVAVLTNTGNNYYPFISAILPYSPASKAGLKKWDIILEMNGVSTLNKPFIETYEMLMGDESTIIRLRIKRLDKEKEVEVRRKPRNEVYRE